MPYGFDATCQGAGETWTSSYRMMTAPDGGLILDRDGMTLTYARFD